MLVSPGLRPPRDTRISPTCRANAARAPVSRPPGSSAPSATCTADELVAPLVPPMEQFQLRTSVFDAVDRVDRLNDSPRRLLPASDRTEVNGELDLGGVGVRHPAALAD